MGEQLYDSTLQGMFDGSTGANDQVIFISMIGSLAILSGIYIRSVFLNGYLNVPWKNIDGIKNLFFNYKIYLIPAYILILLAIATSNHLFTIYQKGLVPQTDIFPPLFAFYKWFLLYGSSVILSIVIYLEIIHKKKFIFYPFLLLFLDLYIVNLSLLSRSMILNGTIIFVASVILLRHTNISLKVYKIVLFYIAFLLLSFSSIIHVNILRSSIFISSDKVTMTTNEIQINENQSINIRTLVDITRPLLIDRWVGIEGLMAVQGYKDKGFHLYSQAMKEKPNNLNPSFFDLKFINNKYSESSLTKYNFNTSPGIIAFLFYSNSYLMVYFGLLFFCLFFSMIDLFSFRISGSNIVFTAIISNVLAYRLVSFGYSPINTPMILFSVFLSLLLIFLISKYAKKY